LIFKQNRYASGGTDSALSLDQKMRQYSRTSRVNTQKVEVQMSQLRKSIFYVLGIILLMTSPALAQGQKTQTLTQGNIESNFLIAPDYKFSEVDGDFAGLAGFYGGWLINQKFLIGGGAYFQTNGGDTSDMRYGGAVMEYFFNPSRVANISVRGLVGAGSATLNRLRLGRIFPNRFPGLGDFDLDNINLGNLAGGFGLGRPFGLDLDDLDLDSLLEVEETFLVAEPEVNVTLNVTEKFRIGFGGGYRFIGAADGFEDRLNGFTANVAAQFRF
jgi:hypothetical protein